MKKTLLVALTLIFFAQFQAHSQIAFQTLYGGSLNEDGRWMEQMPDSGFIMTGGTTTFSNGQTDFWLVRTDKYGNEMWRKSIGGTAFDFANMVKPVSNGFVICGVTNRNGSDDAIIVKTDLNGNTVWTTVVGDNNIQWFEGLIPTTDGGYAAVGVNTGAGTHGTYDAWLVKFNSSGVKLWEKSIGGQSYEIGNSIQQTPDGGFVIGGQTYSYGALDGDFWLAKTDSLGVLQWQQTYAQPHLQECHYAQCTPDGGYILVGDADTLPNGYGDTDVWLIKTDSAGNMQWDKVFGGSKKDGGKTVENTSDGGFVIGGITRSFGLINPNYYLVKTDGTGALEWQITSYGTSHHDHAYRAIETSDFGFAIFGYFRDASATMDFALVKLGPNGGITRDISVEEIDEPLTNLCRSNGVPISVTLTNFGATNEANIQVVVEISNNSTTTTLTDTFIGSLAPTLSTTFTLSQTYDFNVDGAYNIKAYTVHRNGDISYANDTASLAVTVTPPVSDPHTTSAVSCVNAALTLTATPAVAADSMFWFDAGSGGNLIGTGNTYNTPTLSSTQTYYVQSLNGKGSKVGPLDNSIGSGGTSSGGKLKFDSRKEFILVSVKVFTTSAGNRTIELRNSAGGLVASKVVSLPIAAGGIRVYLNFTVPQGNDFTLGLGSSSGNLFRNTAGASFPYSVSQTLEIYGTDNANAGYYYYFYDWEIFVKSQSCESNMVPVQGIISNGSVSALDQSRCGTGPVTLSANSNYTVSWYDAANGGNLLHTGNTYTTPSISTTHTYYMDVNGCPNRYAVDAIVNNTSSAPTAPDVIHCGPGQVTLSATATDPVSWYTAASNGVLITTGPQYTTPHLNATTTYYVRAGTDCPSSAVAVQAIIDAANPPTVTGATACGPASVILSASSPDPVRWYTTSTGGSPIYTQSNYTTPILANPTTYYVEAGQTCSSIRVPVLADITVVPAPVGSGASRCGSGAVVLSAQSNASVTWWTASSGGTQVGFGTTFTTPSISNTTTYYAMASQNSCNSGRTAVVAIINITSPPSVTGDAHCGAGTLTLSATSSDTVYWYANNSGGNPLAHGTSFTTPNISTTTTYYAQASLSCPSSRIPVVATISSQAANPVTTNGDHCGTGSVVLIATSPDPITWYDAATGGNVVGTGNNLQTPSISTTTTYYAIAGLTGCLSQPIPAVATINPKPLDPTSTGKNNCGPASLTLNATSPDTIHWYNVASGGTSIATGPSYTQVFNSTTTLYVEATNGLCISNRVPVIATIYNNPVINIGPASVLINQGTTITLDPGPGYASYNWSTGVTTQSIIVGTQGSYWVSVTDNHGCHGSDTIVVNIQVGITDNELNDAFVVYPNPSNGEINIVVNNATLRFDLRITDVVGQTLIMENHRDNANFNKRYDLSSFAKGMYFVKLTSENGSVTRPILIQ
jgi:hypothetical protein